MPRKVLVAEDSLTMQRLVAMTLKASDLQVDCVGSGRDALSKAHELRPDLILADVSMTDMDGFAVCEALKADPNTAAIPVILLAAASVPVDEARVQAVGADACIPKPFESQQLIDKVTQLVNGGVGEPAPPPAIPAAATPTPAAPIPVATATPASPATPATPITEPEPTPLADPFPLEDALPGEPRRPAATPPGGIAAESLTSPDPDPPAPAPMTEEPAAPTFGGPDDTGWEPSVPEAPAAPMATADDGDSDMWSTSDGLWDDVDAAVAETKAVTAEETASGGGDLWGAEEPTATADPLPDDGGAVSPPAESVAPPPTPDIAAAPSPIAAPVPEPVPEPEYPGLPPADDPEPPGLPPAAADEPFPAFDAAPIDTAPTDSVDVVHTPAELANLDAFSEPDTSPSGLELDDSALPPPPAAVEPEAAPEPATTSATPTANLDGIPAERLEAIVRDVARSVLEKIAWEVVPDLAEEIIKDEIERLTKK